MEGSFCVFVWTVMGYDDLSNRKCSTFGAVLIGSGELFLGSLTWFE